MAFVRWEVFRSGKRQQGGGHGGGQRIFDYACPKKRLVDIVGNGGTLWLVTSRRRPGQPRRYHLAYKLVDCSSVPADESASHGYGPYAVRGKMRRSTHFGFNDATETLRKLRFTSGESMGDGANLGLRLLGLPELTDGDIDRMERLEHRLVHGRTIFVSYAHKDEPHVAALEQGLARHDIHIHRDETILRGGDAFAEALRKEVRSVDCVLVVISRNAARSEWVRSEVAWALADHRERGFVKRIVPLLLPSGRLDDFPDLRGTLHCRKWPRQPDATFFANLAADIRGMQPGQPP
mgnify:FL=1